MKSRNSFIAQCQNFRFKISYRCRWLLIIQTLLVVPLYAQNYTAYSIPDSLKENAYAVIREYTREFELHSLIKATERIRLIITVLDNNGDDYGILNVEYDRNSKVTIYEATIYDKNGKRAKKISQSDISDIPSTDGVTLYSDNRRKVYKPSYGDYPYTVEYEYEISRTNLISYGMWFPLYAYNLAVEHSKFTFIHPTDILYKKKEINLCSGSEIKYDGKRILETWVSDFMRPVEYEPFAVNFSERVPNLDLMPVKLVYDNYTGTATNWKEYGQWINDLFSGRDELPESEKIKITKLLENRRDTTEKIRLLYEYMQENTRYVGIQLGIGGYQPFPASTVIETGYGDCKALTNYMHSLLRQIGIVSYPALVSAGEYIKPFYSDFPNFHQFNHVILCVPLKKDTIWLECTNSGSPFGFLGNFTDDRDVLLITGDGGKLSHTKKYGAEENLRTSHAEFIIDRTGSASCTMKTQYRGLQYYYISGLFSSSKEEQKQWLNKNSSFPSQQVNDFNIKNYKQTGPLATIEESLVSKNYCSFTGNYMIFPLNLSNAAEPAKKMTKERKSDFIINRSSIDYDTLIYTIPRDYKIESHPSGKTINSAYGEYTYSVSIDTNKITYIRKLVIKQGRFKASEYKSFYDFYLAVSKADNEKVMLSR